MSRRTSTVSTIEIRGASSRRKASEQQSPPVMNIPTGPRSDREKESSRSQHKSSSRHHTSDSRSSRDNRERNHHSSSKPESKAPTTGPAVTSLDPHAQEREARNRERLLKETQRIAGMAGGHKRSRDDGGDGGADRKSGSRKKGRRGGVVGEEDEEARLAKMEAERENARWS